MIKNGTTFGVFMGITLVKQEGFPLSGTAVSIPLKITVSLVVFSKSSLT